MAFITDPDDLNQGTEVVINTGALTIQLLGAGNLGDAGTQAADNGVTHQALYSFLKEEWRTDATLIPFPFPITAITPEQFEWVSGWEPADDTTRNFIRTGGWREVAAGGAVKREYLGVVSLGNIFAGNTPYYFFSSQTAPTSFSFDGEVNQAIQTFGDASNGNFDRTTDALTVAIRVFGNTFGQSTTEAIGIPSGNTLVSQVARFPLAEAEDLTLVTLAGGAGNLTTLFNSIVTTPATPYDQMDIEYFATAQTRSGFNAVVGDTPSAGDAQFGVVVDADNGAGGVVPTAEQIYAFVQAQLTRSVDINAGAASVIGQLADPLLQFIGSNLESLSISANPQGAGGTGVVVDNFGASDTNRIGFRDNDADLRSFPFVAAGSINFNENLQNDASARYWMFFTTNPTGNFGSATAVLVDDNSGTDINGDVSGAPSVSFDFDYDGNVQGGRTAATDAPITIVALGLTTAQYVVATGTITRAVGQSVSLVSARERNYANA